MYNDFCLFADDDSRVVLQRNNDNDSDYINASYIDESHKLYFCIEISDENIMDMLSS